MGNEPRALPILGEHTTPELYYSANQFSSVHCKGTTLCFMLQHHRMYSIEKLIRHPCKPQFLLPVTWPSHQASVFHQHNYFLSQLYHKTFYFTM